MALPKIFDLKDIDHLLEQNSMPPHGRRNAALIACGVGWGLTLLEMSKVRNVDVMSPCGELYRIWVLPAHIAFNGKPREIITKGIVFGLLDKYINIKKSRKLQESNTFDYRCLLDTGELFLNDNNEPYKIDKREGNKSHARGIMSQFKKMIENTGINGATPSSFRESFINLMFEQGVSHGELMKATGIKQKKTIDKKLRQHERELTQALDSVFSRVKLPENLFDT